MHRQGHGSVLRGAVAVVEGPQVDLAALLQAARRRAPRLPDVGLPPPGPLVLAATAADHYAPGTVRVRQARQSRTAPVQSSNMSTLREADAFRRSWNAMLQGAAAPLVESSAG